MAVNRVSSVGHPHLPGFQNLTNQQATTLF